MDLSGLEAVEGDYDALVERIYTEEWTDGLPVVIPTPDLVEAMIGTRDPNLLIGNIPPRGLPGTIGALAVSAVMAGCRPEYFPLVIASVQAALQPQHNLNGVTCTTH